jgi:hypothetical protein
LIVPGVALGCVLVDFSGGPERLVEAFFHFFLSSCNYSACFVRIIGVMFHPVSIKAGFLPWKSNLKAKVAVIPCLRQVDKLGHINRVGLQVHPILYLPVHFLRKGGNKPIPGIVAKRLRPAFYNKIIAQAFKTEFYALFSLLRPF